MELGPFPSALRSDGGNGGGKEAKDERGEERRGEEKRGKGGGKGAIERTREAPTERTNESYLSEVLKRDRESKESMDMDGEDRFLRDDMFDPKEGSTEPISSTIGAAG